MNNYKNIWESTSTQRFAEIMTLITDITDMQNFMRDVMTEKEITEIAARLKAANMLADGKKYIEVINQTGLSSRTVARIREWMQSGTGGYKAALTLIENHHAHTSPARTE